jgi:hypothetical protein
VMQDHAAAMSPTAAASPSGNVNGRGLAVGDRVVTHEGFIARVLAVRSGRAGLALVDLGLAGMSDRIGVPVASCRGLPPLNDFIQQLSSGALLGPRAPSSEPGKPSATSPHAIASSEPHPPARRVEAYSCPDQSPGLKVRRRPPCALRLVELRA